MKNLKTLIISAFMLLVIGSLVNSCADCNLKTLNATIEITEYRNRECSPWCTFLGNSLRLVLIHAVTRMSRSERPTQAR